jgi:hypothetical protein
MKLYDLADWPTEEEAAHHKFRTPHETRNEGPGRSLKAMKTGEFRQPRAGEWFLSGAIPQGYRAINDMAGEYHILRLVVANAYPGKDITIDEDDDALIANTARLFREANKTLIGERDPEEVRAFFQAAKDNGLINGFEQSKVDPGTWLLDCKMPLNKVDLHIQLQDIIAEAPWNDESPLRKMFKMRRIERTDPEHLMMEVKKLVKLFDEMPEHMHPNRDYCGIYDLDHYWNPIKKHIEDLRNLVQLLEAHHGVTLSVD